MEDSYQRSWFSKNWPWVLPVGCCSGCLIMILVFGIGIGTAIFSVFSGIQEISPIEKTMEKVNQHPKAIEALGHNIEKKGFPIGNISVNNNNGEVKFSIQVEGEKGIGTLYVNGIRANKKWIYEDLYIIEKETAEEINLLDGL